MGYHLVARTCLRCLVLVWLAALVLPTASWAANRYVRAGAIGNGSGSDWTNAYPDLPASLVRGDTYYVATGSYSYHFFSDAESGTSVITVKAATLADHGTNTGWSTSYVGQASFAGGPGEALVWVFTTGYYTLDGVYGCSPSAACGFRVDASKTTATGCGQARNTIQLEGGVGNVTFQYIEVKGTANTALDPNNINDSGFFSRAANHDLYFGHVWVHDQGGLWMVLDGDDKVIIEYSWFRNNHSTPLCHSEGIALRAPSGLGNTNLTIRYNRFENADGTAYIGTPVNLGLTGPTSSNWYVYGNIFSYNAAESNGQPKAAGIFQIFAIKIAGDFSFYNNTISSLDNGPLASGSCRIIFATGSVNTRVEKLTVRNNIWYNCVNAIAPPGTGLSGLVTQIWDHNAYFATPLSGSGDPSELNASGNPFKNVTQNLGATDFHLLKDTSVWTPLASPYNIDPDSVTRTSSRGAYQFAPSRPNPPTNATVR